MIGFLFDENATPEFRDQLLARAPDMHVYVIGDGVAPPKSTPDPDILLWIEAHDCILATYNYSTMPVHLRAHLAQGHHDSWHSAIKPGHGHGRNFGGYTAHVGRRAA